jgi:hypothetical protein
MRSLATFSGTSSVFRNGNTASGSDHCALGHLADWPANVTGRGTHDHFPCTAHQGTHQSMLADQATRSLPGRLGPEERRPEYPVGRGRGDRDAAHEILETNIYHIY